MRKCLKVQEIKNFQEDLRKNNKQIGLVPTMGALHDGHLELIKTSQEHNDVTIVSIFVNRLQFNDPKDFELYPRMQEQDLKLLHSLGVDAVFMPEEKEIYPTSLVVNFELGTMANTMEGEFRPGHFQGVCIVLAKFFHLVQPHTAYFGLKDLQQYLIVKRMVEDLSFNLAIFGVETKRAASGLALSSRNLRLSDRGKDAASNLYKGLEFARGLITERVSVDQVNVRLMELYQETDGLSIEYCKVVDARTLNSIRTFNGVEEIALCVAAYVEGVRLIDNLYLRLN